MYKWPDESQWCPRTLISTEVARYWENTTDPGSGSRTYEADLLPSQHLEPSFDSHSSITLPFQLGLETRQWRVGTAVNNPSWSFGFFCCIDTLRIYKELHGAMQICQGSTAWSVLHFAHVWETVDPAVIAVEWNIHCRMEHWQYIESK